MLFFNTETFKGPLLGGMRVLAAVTILFLSSTTQGQVQFDGKTWYISEDPASLRLNSEGHLEWIAPHPPQQLIVRLPEMPLQKPGDTAEVRYLYKADAPPQGPYDPNSRTRPRDLTGMSGTGDFRIGLFDSNEKGYIEQDGHDYTNNIWRGYLGYHVRVFPHIPPNITRFKENGEVHLPGKMMKRDKPDSHSLLSSAKSYRNWGPDISGFEAPLGRFVPLILRLTRTDADTVKFTVTIDKVTYHRSDAEKSLQPAKIDVLGIYFPNPRPYSKVTLAPMPVDSP